MLYFNLQPIFTARQIAKPHSFLVRAGISPQTVSRILNNQMLVMRMKHIEILCRALYCEPNDLVAWRPDAAVPLPESHPLYKFVPSGDKMDWAQQVKTMPLKELKEMMNPVREANEGQ